MTKRSSSSDGGGEYEVGYRKPPISSQFMKGRSGNPKGRPRKTPVARPSPFDLVLEKTLTINRDGNRQEVTPEEALQQALLQRAFKGDRSAIRKVLKMIQQHQAAIAALAPAAPPAPLIIEELDPDNAKEALLLLGIGQQDPEWGTPRLKLLPWAMQAALDRRRRPAVRSDDLALLKNSVLGPEQVRWPEPGGCATTPPSQPKLTRSAIDTRRRTRDFEKVRAAIRAADPAVGGGRSSTTRCSDNRWRSGLMGKRCRSRRPKRCC